MSETPLQNAKRELRECGQRIELLKADFIAKRIAMAEVEAKLDAAIKDRNEIHCRFYRESKKEVEE